ncbi:aminopeptidase N [Arenibaculum pallidiluteum]|uniref:aminopeptidase N n=1 Tax=Arenibaculum pallidiluteum TaxID=2812559 RepID=UPI001A979DA7|nr:aminopeptidase N [Arenibaculum pallidiluteum]
MDKGAPQAIYLKDYRPPAFLIDDVDLRFELGEEATRVRSRLAMRPNPAAQGSAATLVLDGQDLVLVALSLDGAPLAPGAYRVGEERLEIPGVPDRPFVLEVETEIRPQDNTSLEGLYKSSGNFCTQCEAEGFRKITYFLDRPDVMARYRTTIVADKARYPVLLSNGNPTGAGELEGGRHWATWEDPFPKPCYLFALVAGNLVRVSDSFETVSGRSIDLRIYVEPGNEDKVGHAMASLKRAMRWDEEVYGLEYDLDIFMIVAVSDFNMGAMENKGLNIFNTKYVLARPESATDVDFEGVEAVVAHEYFHNWTGNRVTCRDWFQLSLKEGLTVFRDQEFSADMHSRAVERIGNVAALRTAQFAEDASPMAHPVRPETYIEINNFYTTTVYEKGAEVVRMIHTLLGPAGFRKGMDLYFERHDGQAVTCEDFVAAMEDATGVDLGQFRLWYAQAGTPTVEATGSHDADARRYQLKLRQTVPPTPGQPVKKPMHIPVAMGLLDAQGRDIPLRLAGEAAPGATTRVLDLREAEQTFVFEDVAAPPVPSLLRGFSAPVKLRTEFDDAALTFLMAHDSDAFNRWEAGQQLATRLLLRLVAEHEAGRPLALDAGFVDAMGRILGDRSLDPEFAAAALGLPGEGYLGQQMDVVSVDAIHAARQFVRRSLAEALRAPLMETYRRLAGNEDPGYEAEAAGRRSLKNTALGYLMALDDRESVELCLGQFRMARTMTESIAALGLLAQSDAPERIEALDSFLDRWRDEALVVNKWLGVQATSQRTDTLDRVKALLDHPVFEIRNPNKVYALIGGFAGGNIVRFHDASGAGYRFLADQVIRLDALNPQVASRMVKPFSRWRKYDAGRQALMRAELERITAVKGLSRDVFEIASKSLAD